MTEIRNSILAGLAFGLLLGLIFAGMFDTHYAILAGPISGLACGTALYFFVTSETVKRQTQIENLNGKPIIRSEGANHFINGEAVGGKLFLLTDKLQFQSHRFNIQNHGQIKISIKLKKSVFTTRSDLFLMDSQLQLLADKHKNSLLMAGGFGKKS